MTDPVTKLDNLCAQVLNADKKAIPGKLARALQIAITALQQYSKEELSFGMDFTATEALKEMEKVVE